MPHDFSITQKVRTALREAGRDDLVDEQIVAAIRALEGELRAELQELRAKIHGVENMARERATITGVHRAISEAGGKQAVDWLKWGKRAGLAAALGVLIKLAIRGLTT